MKEAAVKVTLDEEPVAGSYVVEERLDDGTLILRPEREPGVTPDPAIEKQIAEIVEHHSETLDRLAR